VLLPSWPLALSPQAQTVPSDLSARLWASPEATATGAFDYSSVGTGEVNEA
jgi:hypothetical protein